MQQDILEDNRLHNVSHCVVLNVCCCGMFVCVCVSIETKAIVEHQWMKYFIFIFERLRTILQRRRSPYRRLHFFLRSFIHSISVDCIFSPLDRLNVGYIVYDIHGILIYGILHCCGIPIDKQTGAGLRSYKWISIPVRRISIMNFVRTVCFSFRQSGTYEPPSSGDVCASV